MTRFAYDEFAKDFLEELLSPLGEVKAPLEVRGETRQVDVWFAPALEGEINPEEIGLLGKMATKPALFEPFRNAATANEICTCILKLLELRTDFQRQGNRKGDTASATLRDRPREDDYPRLWIITPTASKTILEGFGAKLDLENWLPGIYFCPKFFRTALVVIHKLPKNQETLWLRLLGRGRVQQRAIDEIEALPETDPFRSNALLLLSNLQTKLTDTQEQLQEEDRELIMRLSPLLTKQLQEAKESGKDEGREEGVQQGQRMERQMMIENFFRARFGSVDEELSTIIEPMLLLPYEELTQILMQLSSISREDLLSRFSRDNS